MERRLVDVERILVTRLRFIGDVLLTTPMLRAMRGNFPQAYIAYMTEPSPGEMLVGNPDIDELILTAPQPPEPLLWLRWCADQVRFLGELRKRRFDLVADLLCNPRSAVLCLATGAPQRVGFSVRGRRVAYNVKIRSRPGRPATEAYLDALRSLGLPVTGSPTLLRLFPEEICRAREWLREAGARDGEALVGLNPGASWPAKTWPWRNFAEVGSSLVRRFGARVIVFWGPGQIDTARNVAEAIGAPALLAPESGLRMLAALIKQCNILVTNDCGPMHISAAVGTRTLGIFGPGDPRIWFPYSLEDGHRAMSSDVPCHPCNRDFCDSQECMRRISPAGVAEAAAALLEQPAENRLTIPATSHPGTAQV